MTKTTESAESKPRIQKEDPGLFESYGSFPVWMLKLIHLVTPAFLINKPSPPKKEDPK